MDQYISYHKQPYSKFLGIRDFNQKFGTSIPEHEAYENYFQHTLSTARRAQGPDEFLLAKLATQEEFEEVGWKDYAKKKAKQAKEKMKKAGKAVVGGLEIVSGSKETSLDDLLSEPEEVEAEYDEPKSITSEKKQITDIVMSASEDSDAYSQDMKHLIRFKNTALPLRDQLLKGRPRYLKAIKAYLKGDKTAEIKMSFREKNKLVKIADLNPKRDSLKALLRSEPGDVRVVECL